MTGNIREQIKNKGSFMKLIIVNNKCFFSFMSTWLAIYFLNFLCVYLGGVFKCIVYCLNLEALTSEFRKLGFYKLLPIGIKLLPLTRVTYCTLSSSCFTTTLHEDI